MYTYAIVKKLGKSYIDGLTTSELGKPNYEKALEQHEAYTEALKKVGLEIEILKANEDYPDSTFVEDTAVLTPELGIITHPGAPSRVGEIIEIEDALTYFYEDIHYIQAPGTLEGGDVLQIDEHFYIGLSKRTNEHGAQQLKTILEKSNYQATIISLEKLFHLKTGISYIGKNTITVTGELIEHPDFRTYEKIIVPLEEAYAANCIRVNDYVIMPKGYPKTTNQIKEVGFKTIELDMSEFEKQDGGLSCLSLRF